MTHLSKFTVLATATAISLFTLSASAQVVTVTDENGQTLNGTVVNVQGDTTGILSFSALTTNTSGTDRTINVKRYETSVQPGTKNYFCWDLCFNAADVGTHPLWVSDDPRAMVNGEEFNGFHAYYVPQGVAGVSSFRYVWYDYFDTNDSAWVDIVFNSMPVGIHEIATPVRSFTVSPNPSMGGEVTLTYDLSAASVGDRLVVYNMLGERKLVRMLDAAQGKVVLSQSDLAPGVWFATLERNGRSLTTKRVVIAQ